MVNDPTRLEKMLGSKRWWVREMINIKGESNEERSHRRQNDPPMRPSRRRQNERERERERGQVLCLSVLCLGIKYNVLGWFLLFPVTELES